MDRDDDSPPTLLGKEITIESKKFLSNGMVK